MSVFGISGEGAPKSGPVETIADGNFDYQEPVYIETSQKSFNDFWIQPQTDPRNGGPYTFSLPQMPDRYMMLNKAGIECKMRVVGRNGEKLNWKTDVVAPVNLLGVAMWKEISVSLNHRPMPGVSSVEAGLKAVMEARVSYDTDSANTHLRSQFYYRDTPNQMSNFRMSREIFLEKYCEDMINGIEPEPFYDPGFDPIIPGTNPPQHLRSEHQRRIDINSVKLPRVGKTHIDQADDARHWEQKRTLNRFRVYQQHFNERYGYYMATFNEIPKNQGFEDRYSIVAGSEEFDTYSPIPHDFFKMSNLIGPDNKVVITLSKYSDAYLLNTYMPDPGYKLEILSMRMHVHCVQRTESMALPKLERYLFNQTELHFEAVNPGNLHATAKVHHGGVRPKTVLVTFAPISAIDGRYDNNPHNSFTTLTSRTSACSSTRSRTPPAGSSLTSPRPTRWPATATAGSLRTRARQTPRRETLCPSRGSAAAASWPRST